jgi:hypothetical protein
MALHGGLTRGRSAYGLQYTLLYDLAAISVGAGENLLPEHLQRGPGGISLARLRELYTPDIPDPLFFGPEPHLPATEDARLVRAIEVQWARAVLQRPDVYARHRLTIVAGLLGLHEIGYTFHHGIDRNDLGVSLTPSPWNRGAMRYLEATAKSPLVRGWVYLVAAAVVLAVLALSQRSFEPAVIALLGSAFLYAVPYAIVSPSQDFRYLWWPVVVSLVLPFIAFGPGASRAPRGVAA